MQKPLELIHARNLLTSISTPACLIGLDGVLEFYNDAAAAIVGGRFEDRGKMRAEEWVPAFGPVDAEGNPLDFDKLPLVAAVREGRPDHAHHRIRVGGNEHRDIAVSAIPIVGGNGFSGAMVFYWPQAAEE